MNKRQREATARAASLLKGETKCPQYLLCSICKMQISTKKFFTYTLFRFIILRLFRIIIYKSDQMCICGVIFSYFTADVTFWSFRLSQIALLANSEFPFCQSCYAQP